MIAEVKQNQSKEQQRQLEAERVASLRAGDALNAFVGTLVHPRLSFALFPVWLGVYIYSILMSISGNEKWESSL